MIISALIHILQENGELTVGDSIAWHLPLKAPGIGKIQIRHCIAHTSGLSDDKSGKAVSEYIKETLGITLPEGKWEDIEKEWNTAVEKARIALELPAPDDGDNWHLIKRHLVFNVLTPPLLPDIKMEYCNLGYQLLKELIEKVSGKGIEEFARETIFNPLKMDNTYFILPKEKWDNVVVKGEDYLGYEWQNSPDCFTSVSGSGGLKTTTNDILKFLEMIRLGGSPVLSSKSIARMTSNINVHRPDAWDAWALGFNYRGQKFDDLSPLRSESTISHGGWGGIKTMIDKENKITLAIFNAKLATEPFRKRFPDDCFGRISSILLSAFK